MLDDGFCKAAVRAECPHVSEVLYRGSKADVIRTRPGDYLKLQAFSTRREHTRHLTALMFCAVVATSLHILRVSKSMQSCCGATRDSWRGRTEMTVCTRQYCRLHTAEQVDLRTQYILTLPRHHGCLAKVWPATEACERAESCEVDECHGSSQSDLTSGLSANFQI